MPPGFFCADYGSQAGASDSFTQRVFGIDKAARVGIIYLKPKLHFRYAKGGMAMMDTAT